MPHPKPQLRELSADLWRENAYQAGEPDRVVLCVEHEVTDGSETVWHCGYSVDEVGDERGSAMARLVSLTAALAVESIRENRLPGGVLAATSDRSLIRSWIGGLREMGESIHRFGDG